MYIYTTIFFLLVSSFVYIYLHMYVRILRYYLYVYICVLSEKARCTEERSLSFFFFSFFFLYGFDETHLSFRVRVIRKYSFYVVSIVTENNVC